MKSNDAREVIKKMLADDPELAKDVQDELSSVTSGRVCKRAARNIQRIRIARGWTQRDLALLIKMQQPALCRIERDGVCSLRTLIKIATGLRVDVVSLLEEQQ